jgi:hypothetical protein
VPKIVKVVLIIIFFNIPLQGEERKCIVVDLKCQPAIVKYGQNIQFDVTFKNCSKDIIRLNLMEFNSQFPKVYAKAENGVWALIRRSSIRYDRTEKAIVELKPDESFCESALLYYDLWHVGNLLPGKYHVKIRNPLFNTKGDNKHGTSGDVFSEEYIMTGLQVESDDTCNDFLSMQKSLNDIHQANNLLLKESYVKEYQKFIKNNPNASMFVDLNIEVAILNWDFLDIKASNGNFDEVNAVELANSLFSMAESVGVLPLQKEKIYELVFDRYHSGYKNPNPYLKATVLLLNENPNNKKAKKRVSEIVNGVSHWNNEIVSENYIRYYSDDSDFKNVIDSFDLRYELLSQRPDLVKKLHEFKKVLLEKRK